MASYTFSRSISYPTDWASLAVFHRNRALSSYDIPHNFQAGWVIEEPFGRGKRWAREGISSALLGGGWQLTGIFSRYSGTPFHVTSSGTSLNAPGNLQTADQVQPEVKILGGTGRDDPYFGPLTFRPVTAVRYGNSGIFNLRGPGVVNVDNVSNLLLNADGSVNSLRGYSDITFARQDERKLRFGLRVRDIKAKTAGHRVRHAGLPAPNIGLACPPAG